MRYSGLIKNDITAAPGLCVSFFTQGCPHHCPGCHNPDTWAFDRGKEFTNQVLDEILEALTAQNIHRDFCIMGGEPLCDANAFLTRLLIQEVKKHVPDAKIYIWSGYTYEELLRHNNPHVLDSLREADVLIDGPYIEAERDLTLPMRGSRNQRIIDLSKKN